MADMTYLNSTARGTWEYEIEEGKTKIKYPINFGFNEIPPDHMKVLNEDLGFKAKIERKVYKILNKKQALVADKNDEKVIDKARELNQAKDIYKGKIAELKKEHEDAIKKNKTEFLNQTQQLTVARGEALNKVKEVEKEIVSLKGKLANIEDKHKSEIDNVNAANAKEMKKLSDANDGILKAKKDLEQKIEELKKAK